MASSRNCDDGSLSLSAAQPIMAPSSSAKGGVMYRDDMYIALRLFLGWFQLMFGKESLSSSKGIDLKLLLVGRIVGSIVSTLVTPDHAWRNVCI